MEVCVRHAGPRDDVALLALIRAHALFEQAEATIDGEALAELLANPAPPCLLFVAAQGGGLVGYAALTLDFALWRGRWWGHLDCLYVEAAERGLAIGPKLLRAAAEAARIGWSGKRLRGTGGPWRSIAAKERRSWPRRGLPWHCDQQFWQDRKRGYREANLISLALVYRFNRNRLPTREPHR